MKFDDIKARWQGYSPRKKWTIAVVGTVLSISVANGDHDGSGGRNVPPGHESAGRMFGGLPQPGLGGTYAGAGYGGSSNAGRGLNGGTTSDDAPVDVTSGWRHNQAVQDRAASAFDQNIRDESTIRSSNNGEVYSGVSNPVADGAVESGAATQVPTAELPTSTEPEK